MATTGADPISPPRGLKVTPVKWYSFTYAIRSVMSRLNVSQNAICFGSVFLYFTLILLAWKSVPPM